MDSETKKLMEQRLSGVLGYQAECRARLLAGHAQWLALLRTRGVVMVRAEYEGCGDSGQLEPCACFAAESVPADDRVGDAEREQIRDHFYDLLECRHGGWENNDGATGRFEWHIASDALTHEHHAYYTETDTSTHQGMEDIEAMGKAGAP